MPPSRTPNANRCLKGGLLAWLLQVFFLAVSLQNPPKGTNFQKSHAQISLPEWETPKKVQLNEYQVPTKVRSGVLNLPVGISDSEPFGLWPPSKIRKEAGKSSTRTSPPRTPKNSASMNLVGGLVDKQGFPMHPPQESRAQGLQLPKPPIQTTNYK